MAKGAGFEISGKEFLLVAAIGAALIWGTGSALEGAGRGLGLEPIGQGIGGGIKDITGIIPWAEQQFTGFEQWIGSWT